MALDGMAVHALCYELQSIVGGRISKIHQPNDHDVVWQVRSGGANYRLLLSASATYPRVHFTERQYINPLEAPMFCMLMRKHFEGGVIEEIKQVGMERMLYLDVRQRDELGDLKLKRVIVELMGRHSNIIMLDPESGTILDGIRRVTPAISRYRVVLPGSTYVNPPDQAKANPLLISAEQMRAWAAENYSAQLTSRRATEKWLVERFEGISPLAAKEIVHRSDWPEEGSSDALNAAAERLAHVWKEWMELIRTNRYQPVIVDSVQSGKSHFYIFPLYHLGEKSRIYPSFSECLETFYSTKAEQDIVKQKAADLFRFLQNEKNKNVKKLEKLQETLEEAAHADDYRILGDLLIANLHRIKRGDKEVEVVNYYDEEQRTMTIPLDPQLSPSENAQRQFKKYTKGKNSIAVVKEQMDAAEIEIAYIESLLQQLEAAGSQDIDEIRDELAAGGYVRQRGKTAQKKRKTSKPQLTCYYSSEGIEIYVGKNNTQNEYLTNRFANPSDTWLHTKDIPGSHVVIRSTQYSEETLEEAAMIAAYYSKARESSQVPVDYTLVRHVRKPNGAKPGFVIYEQQKTLFVTPDEHRLLSLKKYINNT